MVNKDFYRNAHAYDIAFSDRYFNEECDFLEWCLINHSRLTDEQLSNKSFLEMACGPARHAREFSKRGWRSVGLDISEDMIKFAAEEAKNEGSNIETVVADISDFNIDKPVIMATTLMESISHLVTNEQMISHFKSVARNVVHGGIYVIEATHPLFFFPDNEPNTWVSKNGKSKVEITFGLPNDEYNSVTQQWLVSTRMKITDTDGKEYVTESKSPIRWYLAQEMKALIDLSGVFDKYWFYGSLYNIPPLKLDDSEDSDAMVIVLRVK
jgi:SAM-dependent methyltransferase